MKVSQICPSRLQCIEVICTLVFQGYVGLGTVSAATWWYLYDEGGPQVSFYQLVSETIYSTLCCFKTVWLQTGHLMPKQLFVNIGSYHFKIRDSCLGVQIS